jgi:predicted SpoU family rRNA methylase
MPNSKGAPPSTSGALFCCKKSLFFGGTSVIDWRDRWKDVVKAWINVGRKGGAWNCASHSGGNEMATTTDSRRETMSLIGSDKVESTPVYGAKDWNCATGNDR